MLFLALLAACTSGGWFGQTHSEEGVDTGDTTPDDTGNEAEGNDDAEVRALTDLPEGEYPVAEPILVRIAYISDGDTVYVHPDDGSEGFKVRLIGIDTPEVEHEDSPADCYGDEAMLFTTTEVKDKLAWLTFDAEYKDFYDRVLAYVIRGSGETGFFNRVLARQGYAEQLTVEPNSTFANDFASDVAAARADNLGLWSACR